MNAIKIGPRKDLIINDNGRASIKVWLNGGRTAAKGYMLDEAEVESAYHIASQFHEWLMMLDLCGDPLNAAVLRINDVLLVKETKTCGLFSWRVYEFVDGQVMAHDARLEEKLWRFLEGPVCLSFFGILP